MSDPVKPATVFVAVPTDAPTLGSAVQGNPLSASADFAKVKDLPQPPTALDVTAETKARKGVFVPPPAHVEPPPPPAFVRTFKHPKSGQTITLEGPFGWGVAYGALSSEGKPIERPLVADASNDAGQLTGDVYLKVGDMSSGQNIMRVKMVPPADDFEGSTIEVGRWRFSQAKRALQAAENAPGDVMPVAPKHEVLPAPMAKPPVAEVAPSIIAEPGAVTLADLTKGLK